MTSKTPEISVVVPVYNEAETLAELYARLVATLESLGRPFEIVVVDDGSKDDSLAILEGLRAEDDRIRIVQLLRNFGQTPALYAGFSHARGESIVMIDADLQNPPEEIPKVLAKLEEGYDSVSGWRKKRHDSLFRMFASRMVNRLVTRVMGMSIHDCGCSLKAFTRESIDLLTNLFTHRSRYLPIEIAWLGLNVGEVEVLHCKRKAGTSKYSLVKLCRLTIDLITSITALPIELLWMVGSVFILIALVMGLGAVGQYALHETYNLVWVLLAFFFAFTGIQLSATGIMCEYVNRIFKDVQRKPFYVVRKIHE